MLFRRLDRRLDMIVTQRCMAKYRDMITLFLAAFTYIVTHQ